jgi:hypothetical protein
MTVWTWEQGLPILGVGLAIIFAGLFPMLVRAAIRWKERHSNNIPRAAWGQDEGIRLLWDMWLDKLTNEDQVRTLYVSILRALQTYEVRGSLEGRDVGLYPLWVTHWDRPVGHEVRRDIDWRVWVVRIRALRSILKARGLDTEEWEELTSLFEQRLNEQLPDRIAAGITKMYLDSIPEDTPRDAPPTAWARLLRDDDTEENEHG